MINWKALVAGILTILAIGLLAQFVFLLTATWTTILKNRQEIDPQYLQAMIYSTGFIFALITLAPGGYITARIAKTKVVLHCSIVGAVATIASLATAPGAKHATTIGLVFVVVGIGMTVLGGVIWKRRSKTKAT